jgi:transporter family-2 protein
VDRGAAVLLTALTGGLVAVQVPINSMLGKAVGTFHATFLSLLIGTIAMAGVVGLAGGGFGSLAEARHVPWYYLIGGLLGAAYVTAMLVTVRTLGAGGVTAATISGQLTMSVVVDRFGWLGLEKSPLTVLKVLGIVLLGLGTFLIVRE